MSLHVRLAAKLVRSVRDPDTSLRDVSTSPGRVISTNPGRVVPRSGRSAAMVESDGDDEEGMAEPDFGATTDLGLG
jgi:hypothetical protein